VERQAANPQAAPPQSRAAPGSNSSCHSSVRPTCGTTFQPPVNAGYESYFNECHPVYIDKPDSFFSGQEFEPETYDPVVKKIRLPTMTISPLKNDVLVVNQQSTVDLVPHILATGLGNGDTRSKYFFKCLLDSGGTDPMINRKCTPPLVTLEACPSIKFATTQGKFASVH
jgi:hypothetical protein